MSFDPALPQALVEGMWEEPYALVGDSQSLPKKGRRQTRRGERTAVRAQVENKSFVIKYYSEQSWRHLLKRMVQPSRAAACCRWTWRLIDAGVPTPPPRMYREERFGPLGGYSYLIYEFIEGRTLLSTLLDHSPSAEMVESLAWQFAEIWRCFGESRYSHSDVHMANFIVDLSGKLWVIDLDKARYHRRDRTMAIARRHGLIKFMTGLRHHFELAQVFASHLQVDVRQYHNQPHPRRKKLPPAAVAPAPMPGANRRRAA